MSQSRARLFEKWLASGDERTFGEWLAFRREQATQDRAWRLANTLPIYRGFSIHAEQMRAQMTLQWQQSQLAGMGNALGGIFR